MPGKLVVITLSRSQRGVLGCDDVVSAFQLFKPSSRMFAHQVVTRYCYRGISVALLSKNPRAHG